MGSENRPELKEANNLLTIGDRRLPGAFSALQAQALHEEPLKALATASEKHNKTYVAWAATRYALPPFDTRRNTLFTAPTKIVSGLERYCVDKTPEDALDFLVRIGNGARRALNRVNDYGWWGASDQLKKTLEGKALYPDALLLANDIVSDILARLQARATPEIEQFKRKTMEHVNKFPTAGITYTPDANKKKIAGQTFRIPVFPSDPSQNRLKVEPDMLNPADRDVLEFLVSLFQMTHPLLHAMVAHGVITDELKAALCPKSLLIEDISFKTPPTTFVELPPEPSHEFPPPKEIMKPDFLTKDPPPPVNYILTIEDPRAPAMFDWQNRCLAERMAYLNSPHGKNTRVGSGSVYTPRATFNPQKKTYDIVPYTLQIGSVVNEGDFHRDLAGLVQIQKEHYSSAIEEKTKKERSPEESALTPEEQLVAELNGQRKKGPVSPLEEQLSALKANNVSSVVYNGKMYPITTDENIRELAALIPPYTSIAETKGGRPDAPRTLAAVSGGWTDSKPQLYLGTVEAVNGNGALIERKHFTVPKLKRTLLPQRPKGKN